MTYRHLGHTAQAANHTNTWLTATTPHVHTNTYAYSRAFDLHRYMLPRQAARSERDQPEVHAYIYLCNY